jgi:hypothetical protein
LTKLVKASAGKYKDVAAASLFVRVLRKRIKLWMLFLARPVSLLKERKTAYITLVMILYADMSIDSLEICGMAISKQNNVAYLVMSQVAIKFP